MKEHRLLGLAVAFAMSMAGLYACNVRPQRRLPRPTYVSARVPDPLADALRSAQAKRAQVRKTRASARSPRPPAFTQSEAIRFAHDMNVGECALTEGDLQACADRHQDDGPDALFLTATCQTRALEAFADCAGRQEDARQSASDSGAELEERARQLLRRAWTDEEGAREEFLLALSVPALRVALAQCYAASEAAIVTDFVLPFHASLQTRPRAAEQFAAWLDTVHGFMPVPTEDETEAQNTADPSLTY